MAERSARRRVPVPPSPTASRLVLALVCAVWTVILAVAGASVGLPGQQPAAGAAAAGFERALPAPPGVHTPPWVRVHAPTRERADGHTGGDAELAPAAPPGPGEAALLTLASLPSAGPRQAARPGRLLDRPRQERAPPAAVPGPWSARGPPSPRSS